VHLCMRECVYVCGSRDDNRRAPRVVSDARKCARARARRLDREYARARIFVCVSGHDAVPVTVSFVRPSVESFFSSLPHSQISRGLTPRGCPSFACMLVMHAPVDVVIHTHSLPFHSIKRPCLGVGGYMFVCVHACAICAYVCVYVRVCVCKNASAGEP